MNVERFLKLTPLLVGCVLVVGLGVGVSQQTPPTENKGYKAPVVASLDLGPEIDGMQGRQLRMRILTLEPGGVIAVHPHKDRPSVARVLEGTLTELREGGYVKEYLKVIVGPRVKPRRTGPKIEGQSRLCLLSSIYSSSNSGIQPYTAISFQAEH